MAGCTNCGKVLSCGCQRRRASDGKNVCSSCLSQYEATLKAKRTTAPNTNSFGPDRYKNLQKYIKK